MKFALLHPNNLEKSCIITSESAMDPSFVWDLLRFIFPLFRQVNGIDSAGINVSVAIEEFPYDFLGH